MWIRIIQTMLFLFAYTVEVEVRAAQPGQLSLGETQSPIQVPEDCLVESAFCTIKTRSHQKYKLQLEKTDVVLAPHSAFLRSTQDAGSLISGRVLVKAEEAYSVQTPYGAIEIASGEVLIEMQKDRVRLRVLSGTALMKPLAHPQSVHVEAALENWIGAVNTSGLAQVGILKVLDPKELSRDLAPIYSGTKEDFFALMKSLRQKSFDSTREVANVHETMVGRELARQELEAKNKVERERRWKQERDALRSLLWKKNFE